MAPPSTRGGAPGVLSLDSETYERLYERVRLRLLRIIGPCEDFEDVMQATMERLIKAWRNYRKEGTPEAFADGVALNVARLYLRRRTLTRRIFDIFTEPVERPCRAPGPWEDAESRERMQRLLAILDRVSPKKRIAFAMFYFEGKPVNTISEELGVNRETVKARIFHARKEVYRRARNDPYLEEYLDGA
jgi:RNA polymerase sigma factor (sigma-70 family)